MASNEKQIILKYGDGTKEEQRSNGKRFDYLMEFYHTKNLINEYVDKGKCVAELGCGTGYYGVFLADKCKQYYGVDIAPGNISIFKEKITNLKLTNVKADIGDATDLNHIKDKSFDIVLVLGPMYHLPLTEQKLVMLESKRICKSGGIIFYAYTSKLGVYMRCLNAKYRGLYPSEKSINSVLVKGEDDTRDNIYFFVMPEEIEQMAREHGLQVIKNLGVDFTFCQSYIEDITEEEKELFIKLYNIMACHESCTGFANHAVLICKRL